MMSTRADFEAEMVGRCSQLMVACGLAVTVDGSNASLTGPLGWSYFKIGLTPISGVTPTNDDLSLITVANFFGLCDLAEYRVLVSCRNRWTKTRIQVGANAFYLSDLRDSLDRRLKELEALPLIKGAVGTAILIGGGITLGNFFEPEEEEEALA